MVLATIGWGLALYAAVGAGVALWLLAGGLRRFDANAAAAAPYVKALWAPGLVVLWPIVARRALGAPTKEDRS